MIVRHELPGKAISHERCSMKKCWDLVYCDGCFDFATQIAVSFSDAGSYYYYRLGPKSGKKSMTTGHRPGPSTRRQLNGEIAVCWLYKKLGDPNFIQFYSSPPSIWHFVSGPGPRSAAQPRPGAGDLKTCTGNLKHQPVEKLSNNDCPC
jgi:hypothetical protein